MDTVATVSLAMESTLIINDEIKKYCIYCHKTLPLKNFSLEPRYTDGHDIYCKKCIYDRYAPQFDVDPVKGTFEYKLMTSVNNRIKSSVLIPSWIRPKKGLILGCTIGFYKKWIMSTFTEEMNIDNYGSSNDKSKIWQIDHIQPVKSFDMQDMEDVLKCFNWRNTRACLIKENSRKGGKRDYYLEKQFTLKSEEFLRGCDEEIIRTEERELRKLMFKE
jgi:hypothetical protein